MATKTIADGRVAGGPRRTLASRLPSGPQLALGAVLLLPPLLIEDIYFLHIVNLVGIYTLLAIGLNLVAGFSGQLSVGQAAFYGIGGYASALLSTRLGWPFWPAFLAAGAITTLFGLALGPITRLRGMFLAMATLAFGEIVRLVVINWSDFTNGPNGISAIPPPSLGPLLFDSDTTFYYLVLLTVAAEYLAIRRMVDSRVGRAMKALRDNEEAAAACGVFITRYKMMAFAVAAFFAGLAGSLYAHLVSYFSPENLTFSRSADIIFMIIVGGVGSIPGSWLGAAAVIMVPEYLRFSSDYRMLLYSFIILLILVFAPRGLWGVLVDLWNRGVRLARIWSKNR